MDRFTDCVRWFNYAVPWNKLKYKLLDRAAPRIKTTGGPEIYRGMQGGLQMKLDLATFSHRLIYLNGYEIVTLDLLRRILRPGDTFVDGGANIGLMSLVASRAVGPRGKVFSFEPMANNFAWLSENIRLNQLTNITTIQQGCWHEESTAELYDFVEDGYPISSMGKRTDKDVAGHATIKITPIGKHVAPPVKLIKLDVEGAEWSALRGAQEILTAASKPHLLLEINVPTAKLFGYHPMEMIDWLLQLTPGYRLHLVRSRKVERVTRDEMARRIEAEGDRSRNAWLEPAG